MESGRVPSSAYCVFRRREWLGCFHFGWCRSSTLGELKRTKSTLECAIGFSGGRMGVGGYVGSCGRLDKRKAREANPRVLHSRHPIKRISHSLNSIWLQRRRRRRVQKSARNGPNLCQRSTGMENASGRKMENNMARKRARPPLLISESRLQTHGNESHGPPWRSERSQTDGSSPAPIKLTAPSSSTSSSVFQIRPRYLVASTTIFLIFSACFQRADQVPQGL